MDKRAIRWYFFRYEPDIQHSRIFSSTASPSRTLDVGFVHVETVMQRKSVHFGQVAPHQHPQMGQITYWFEGGGTYRIEGETWNFSAPTISFVPSSVVHGFEVGEGADAFVISISDDLLRTLEPGVDLDLTKPCLIAARPPIRCGCG